MGKQLECRVVITNRGNVFDLGMHDPRNERYAPLGTHPQRDKENIVRGLRERIEREGHLCTISETNSDKLHRTGSDEPVRPHL